MAYCPQFVHRIANGSTVVGSNRSGLVAVGAQPIAKGAFPIQTPTCDGHYLRRVTKKLPRPRPHDGRNQSNTLGRTSQ
jgi:hypothetical protein